MINPIILIVGGVIVLGLVLFCILGENGTDCGQEERNLCKFDRDCQDHKCENECDPSLYGLITQKDSTFRIPDGRMAIFHGVNIVNKQAPYYPLAFFSRLNGPGTKTAGEEWCEYLRDSGFNVVRLGIQWIGVEPLPGQYDDAYIVKMQHIGRTMAKYGLYYILNFQQETWSDGNIPLTPGSSDTMNFFGEGNPVWAARFDGQPNNFSFWSDNLALNAIWTNFWNNVPAYMDNAQTVTDTVGVQDRYIAMRAHVTKFFKNEPNLLYHGMFNEVLPDNNTWLATGGPTGPNANINQAANWQFDFNFDTGLGGMFPPSLLLQNSFDPSQWNQMFTGNCYAFFTTIFPEFREKLRKAIEKAERRGKSTGHLIGQELSFYEIDNKMANVPQESTPQPENLVMGRSSYGIKDYDYFFALPDKQNELVFDQSRATAALNKTGFFAQEWGAGFEFGSSESFGNGYVYEPVMKYFDEKHISWTYWDALGIPTSYPGQSLTFNNPASIGGWYSGTVPSGSTVSYDDPNQALKLDIPVFSANVGTLSYGQYSFFSFISNYMAGDISGRNVTIVLKGIPGGTLLLSDISVKVSFNDANNGFVQQYFETGLLTSTFQPITFTVSSNITDVNQIYLQFFNNSSTDSGSLSIEVQSITLDGPPLSPPMVYDLFLGTDRGILNNINLPIAKMIIEPYPQLIAGQLLKYAYDFQTQVFELTYKSEPRGNLATQIAVPRFCYPQGFKVKVKNGDARKFDNRVEITRSDNSLDDDIYVRITPQ